MKIKTDELTRVISEQVQKGAKQKDAKFDEILQRTIESAGGLRNVSPGVAGNQVAATQAATGIQNIQMGGVSEEEQGPILERIEQLLDTLEDYQRNLGAPNTATGSLLPLIDRLEEHNKTLATILVTLPEGDALKDILNRVLITSVVEVEKFRRGDYS
jgi:hypothetical protein